MKYTFLAILCLLANCTFSQVYTDPVTYKCDLWIAQTYEEGLRTPNDTIGLTWVKSNLPKNRPVLYIDISEKGSMVGIKYPVSLKLSSNGLPNNGYVGKKILKSNVVYEECNLLDETGYLWNVIVGKDGYWEDPEKRKEGRFYIVIHDPKGIRSSYYFTLKTFGK